MKPCIKCGASDRNKSGACNPCTKISRAKIRHAKGVVPREVSRAKICSIEGCGGKFRAKEFCAKHYIKFKQYGDPLAGRTQGKRGGGSISGTGYRIFGSNGKYKAEHVLIAEKAFGRELPKGFKVHHVDENTLNNSPSNLVICPNQGYHNILHRRQRAIDACGNANWLICNVCKKYDDPKNMYSPRESAQYHVECKNEYRKKWRAKRKLLGLPAV